MTAGTARSGVNSSAAGPADSGALIVEIDAATAHAFLARLGEECPGADIALAAREDGALVGVAVLSTRADPGRALVVVSPGGRRRKIGSDLLRELLQRAAVLGFCQLRYTRAHPGAEAHHFVRALGLLEARRVQGGVAVGVVPVPSAA